MLLRPNNGEMRSDSSDSSAVGSGSAVQGLNFSPKEEAQPVFRATFSSEVDESHSQPSLSGLNMAPSVEVVVCKTDEMNDGE